MKNIAVLMGGFSSEHDISIRSGKVIMDALDRELYHPRAVRIMKDGWYHYMEDERRGPVDRNDFNIQVDGEKINFDCCYNTVHGTPGEDGKLQAVLSLLNLPHTSSDFYASAVTFNKRDCLAILKPWNLAMARHYYHNKGESYDLDKIVEKVGLPCFVKANRSGSSFGVSKVYKQEDIPVALQHAYEADDEVIIESFLKGAEVSIGVYGIGDEIIVLPPTEIVSENDFFDYAAKYEGKSQEITPARISKKNATEITQITKRIYEVLKLKGLARVDFILHEGTPHFVEINTTPGMSKHSIVPQQIQSMGLSLTQVLTDIIEDSIKKHTT